MPGGKDPPDRGKDLMDWSKDVEMGESLVSELQSSIVNTDESPTGENNSDNTDTRNVNDNGQKKHETNSSIQSVDNNSERLKELLNNKYRITDPAPYCVYVEHSEQNLGRLFPIRVGHYLFSHSEFKKGIKDIVPVGINRVKVIANTYNVANRLVNHPLLTQHCLRAYIPTFFTQKKGIVKLVDTMFDEEYLKSNIQTNRRVLEVKRLFRKVVKSDGTVEYVKRQMILITFLGTSIPSSVRINFCSFPVEPYVHPVVSCFSCLRFGHRSTQCKGKPRCTRCGDNHNIDDCEAETPSCVHCGSKEHNSTYKKCPAFLRQYNIKKIMAAENITFKEAEFISDNPSYAKVTTHNRFALLDRDENFPELPKQNPTTLLNKPRYNKVVNTTVINKRKTPPNSISPTSPSSSDKPPKRFAFTQAVTPNPYRDEYMKYKETFLCQISTQFGLFLKQVLPENIYDQEQFQNIMASFLNTIKNNVEDKFDNNLPQNA